MAARLTAYIVASIVGVTFIAGLIVGAQRDPDGPVDLIIVNGRVFTAADEARAEAVAVQGNKILRVGSNREIQRLARAQTVVIDARGGSVLPGFNDAHVHALNGGLGLSQVDLLGAKTIEEIGALVRSWAHAHVDTPWVTGRGWYYEPFTGGLPTRQLLDQMVPDRPAMLTSYDGHTAWANTAALKVAGITRRTPNPTNGAIVKEAKSGEPTGVLKEAAVTLLTPHVPQPTRTERLEALARAIGEAHRVGITSIQDVDGSADELELYDELRRDERLFVRVYAALSTDAAGAVDFDRLDTVRARFPDDPLLKTGAIEVVADGVVNAHTAAMLAPYANRATTGQPRYDQAALDRLIAELDRRGWQVTIQASGDAGVRMALDAIERAGRINDVPTNGRRHRVERIDTIDPADAPRFGGLGVVAAMIPFQGLPSQARLALRSANLGVERTARGWMLGSIAENGGRLVFGSDWPGGSLDPLIGLHVAVNRTSLDGFPDGGSEPAERLPLDRAIEAYTSNAAWASFDEQRKGRLAPDMLADIVVLSKDLFALPPEQLTEAEVAFTIFDGKVVFERQVETTEQE